MPQILDPQIDSDLDEWMITEIEEDWKAAARTLSQSWNFDPSLFEGLNIKIIPEFGGKNKDGEIRLSHPDLYRPGMKKIFDSEDESEVREKVDAEYPSQFHEIAEETGQWIGRNYSNGWALSSDDYDVFVDETFGMLALKEIHPDFLTHYCNRIGDNIDTIARLNSPSETDLLQEGRIEDIDVQEMDSRYTRLEEDLTSFAEEMREFVDQNNYDIDNIEYDFIESRRKERLVSETKEWRSYLAACRLVQGEGELQIENPETFLKMPTEDRDKALNYAFRTLDSNIRQDYGIPEDI